MLGCINCSGGVASTSCSGSLPVTRVGGGTKHSGQMNAVTGTWITDPKQAPQEMTRMGELRLEYTKLKLLKYIKEITLYKAVSLLKMAE